jgi:hypothetical protein
VGCRVPVARTVPCPRAGQLLPARPAGAAFRGARRGGSNTFLAHIVRQVPDLAIQLPSNAVGKDFLPGGGLFAAAPSGSGFQLSLYGLFGILLAAREGLEVNLLGLGLGVDPVRPTLKLPVLGRHGMAGL